MGEGGAAMTARIFLIRHGESEWNAAHRYTGQQDVALSHLGREQAQRLAERLADEPLAAIYASPLRRARDTATAIAKAKQLPVILDANLMEINHGLWEGLTADQVEEKFAQELAQWRAQPTHVVMPQGESLGDLLRRVQTSFQRSLAEQRGGTFAICSHDVVLRVVTLYALNLGLERFWEFNFENASLSVLDACNDAAEFRLAALNDTTHLNGARSDHAKQAL
jgi:alpha-ribazole phosphatase